MHTCLRVKLPVIKSVLPLMAPILLTVLLTCTQGESGGFRGIAWGTNIRELSGMSLLAEDAALKFYERKDDHAKIGDVDIERVVYGFYDDQFYSATLYFQSFPSFVQVKRVFLDKYGNPTSYNESSNKYFWGKDEVSVFLSFNTESDEGRVFYSFNPIGSKVHED